MAAEVNLYVDQGANFGIEFIIGDDVGNPINITDFIVVANIRTNYTTTKFIPLTVTKVSPLNGTVTLSLTDIQTAKMEGGRYLYDAQYTTSLGTVRFLEGILTVYPSASLIVPDFTVDTVVLPTTDYILLPANSSRKKFEIQNTSNFGTVWLNFGANSWAMGFVGTPLLAGHSFVTETPALTEIHLATDNPNSTIKYREL
jgi:hypothetical protein